MLHQTVAESDLRKNVNIGIFSTCFRTRQRQICNTLICFCSLDQLSYSCLMDKRQVQKEMQLESLERIQERSWTGLRQEIICPWENGSWLQWESIQKRQNWSLHTLFLNPFCASTRAHYTFHRSRGRSKEKKRNITLWNLFAQPNKTEVPAQLIMEVAHPYFLTAAI